MKKVICLLALSAWLVIPAVAHSSELLEIQVNDLLSATTFTFSTPVVPGLTSLTATQAVTGATVNVVAMSNSPGASGVGNLHLGYVVTFNGASSNFTVLASAQGYTVPPSGPNVTLTNTYGVPVTDPAGLSTFARAGAGNDTLFDSSFGVTPMISPGSTYLVTFPLPSTPYDLVNKVKLTYSGAQGIQSVSDDLDTNAAVPEPATMALLLTALPVLGLSRLRARRKAAA